ncbi:MAG: alpha-glucan family phosphorylase [Bacteroidales bacterium]|nr:alpha-glucan family phosphorylase [Bacteroidales bacterium]
MSKNYIQPDYLFEISWEVCNKVGGIYTVLSSKYESMADDMANRYIFVGPDVWKETSSNPDFIEDRSLFKSWCSAAEKEGLRIRTGWWNIPGKPIAVLVDFTPFFEQKDKIFASLWETYKLDSLSGGWDYFEPALFGYASGKVIESFYNFFLSANDRIIAHFHEWMTGSGILYLKDTVPQIGTVFTTHATILGRSVAGNNLNLYSNLDKYNPGEMARQLGIISKYSLEYNSAHEADCFTTVSEITAVECKHFLSKEIDVLTPNGFSEVFLQREEELEHHRKNAREHIIDVAEALLYQKIDKDAMLILTSGRYEFRNKGLDIFIDALGKLNKNNEVKRQIVAFIAVPGNNAGPRKDLVDTINKPDFEKPISKVYTTHILYDKNHDPVLKRIEENGINNDKGSNVKIFFVPVYLNGSDGIFNLEYYTFLNAFDLTVFPSYYEPWGYTPLESIAYKIPTITTSVAGFGKWVQDEYGVKNNSVIVVERNDENYTAVVNDVANALLNYTQMDAESWERARKESYDIAQKLLWTNLSDNYRQAYDLVNEKVSKRSDLFKSKQSVEYTVFGNGKLEPPEWKKIFVKGKIPAELEPLRELSMNLWWCWNYDAEELFESMDGKLWKETGHNPVAALNRLSFERFQEMKKDRDFVARMLEVFRKFNKYMEQESEKPKEQVAYFSMEFGLHESIRIYSGGLGVLAGDYLKEASDSNKNIIGIGLLYRYGYFGQSLSLFGDQIAQSIPHKFTETPLLPVVNDTGEWVKIELALPGRNLHAKVWRLQVGRIPLYLLDADIEENTLEDRQITHNLYGGDWQNRFKQELLLGVGGIRLLNAMQMHPDIYHLNEGHAAFAGIERLRRLVEIHGFSFETAVEVIRSTSLFTTHTPVPAGHDTFSEDILRTYIPHYADRLNISWEKFMNLGRYHKGNQNEKFSMSILAAKLSQEMNGVSKIHGRVTRDMFRELYPGFFPDELHISHVTNGVHFPTWAHKDWQKMLSNKLGEESHTFQKQHESWKKVNNIPDHEIWKLRQKVKKEFVDFLTDKIHEDLTKRQESPKIVFNTLDNIDESALYIGFARRFATYKRANLLFTSLTRLEKIVSDSEKPVRLVFAGKAHPNDKPGQDLIKRVIEISKMPQFLGKIFFLEDYDMFIGRKMISGVDIWLNTPTRPLEASGTSGEKAVMNGVVNFSVLDGWWAEGYKAGAGWAIKEARTYGNQAFQDELDAETIYQILEDEIIPAFFETDNENIPHKWISYIKSTLSDIAPHFTMKRMLDDYYEKFYSKLFSRSLRIQENGYKLARDIEKWKNSITQKWDGVEVLSVKLPNTSTKPLDLGEKLSVEIIINTNDIPPENLSIEMVLGQKELDQVKNVIKVEDLKFMKVSGVKATWAGSTTMNSSGVYDFAFRIFPRADFLPHKQDFNLVKWI